MGEPSLLGIWESGWVWSLALLSALRYVGTIGTICRAGLIIFNSCLERLWTSRLLARLARTPSDKVLIFERVFRCCHASTAVVHATLHHEQGNAASTPTQQGWRRNREPARVQQASRVPTRRSSMLHLRPIQVHCLAGQVMLD
jgi:hypothetical protein